MVLYILIGAGAVRYIATLISICVKKNQGCMNIWDATLNNLCAVALYPILWLGLFYRAGKLTWKYIWFLCVIPALIPTIVGQTALWMEYYNSMSRLDTCKVYQV